MALLMRRLITSFIASTSSSLLLFSSRSVIHHVWCLICILIFSENEVSNTTPVKKSNSSATKTKDKSELGIEDLPPIQDLHISVRNDEVVEIGRVLHAVDTLGNDTHKDV